MKVGNLEVYGVIYKITNKINGKSYIGQTTRGFNGRYQAKGEGIERVYNYHNYYKSNNSQGSCNFHLLSSIEKYGFENFYVNKVFDVAFSKEELDIKEIMHISLFNCIENGYNSLVGGCQTPIQKGEEHYKAKYSQNQIIKVKELVVKGLSIDEVFEITNVDKKQISNIKNMKSWRDVGIEYNWELEEYCRLKKNRDNYNVENEKDKLRIYYDMGLSALDTCKTLDLIDKNFKGKCNYKVYSEIAYLFRFFKQKDDNETLFCEHCGKEYILKQNKRRTRKRKYCYECSKEVDKIKTRERQRKLRSIRNNK